MRIFRVCKPSPLPSYFPLNQLHSVNIPSRTSTRYYSKALSHEIESTSPKPDTEPYFKYHYLEGVERLEKYRPGGYHPIALNSNLNGRYHIVHKLGYGGFSTIWLARDEKAGNYVAVKICVASSNNSQESKILRQLCTSDLRERFFESSFILPMLDEFIIRGPNGEHQCIVTPLASMSVYAAIDSSYHRPFQLPVARAITAQLIKAIAFLHSQGIVHADIRPDNILLHLSQSIDDLSSSQLYAQYQPPDIEPVTSINNEPLPIGVPAHGIVPVWLGKRSNLVSLSEAKIFLTDFGVSYMPSVATRLYSNIPPAFAPPESQFQPEVHLSFPADIWSLAFTVFNIMGKSPPFYTDFASDTTEAIEEWVLLLGKLPFEWWSKWDTRSRMFNEDGTRNSNNNSKSMVSWEQRFEECLQEPRQEENMEEMGNKEKAALMNMLKAMLRYQPEERLTAQEALESEWMKEWALPEVERMKELRQKTID